MKQFALSVFVFGIIFSQFSIFSPVFATNDVCKDVSLVFSRGSGQNGGDSTDEKILSNSGTLAIEKQSIAFFKEVDAKLPGLTKEFVSLHDFAGKYNNYGYKAVPVMPSMVERADHRNDAINLYFESVKDGADELTGYIKEKIAQCPDQEIILGGYSQGAQITGEALFKLTSQERSHIRYTAFYGDPKLNGHDGSFVLNKGHWLRGNAVRITNGILGARENYVPADMKGRVGSWCDFADPICTGQSISYLADAQLTPMRMLADKFIDRTHSDIYQGKWIPMSANEIAATMSPQAFLDKSNNYVINYSENNRVNDFGLIIDTSGSMASMQSYIRFNRDIIAQSLLKENVTQLRYTKYANKYTEPAYFQENFSYTPAPILLRSNDLASHLMTYSVQSPTKTGYSPLYNGLHQAVITQKNYGRNVPTTNKNFIVITNAKPSPNYVYPNPLMDKNFVLRELLELDPVAVSFLVLPEPITGAPQDIPEYNEVAKATGGSVVTVNKPDDLGSGLTQLTKLVTSSPISIIRSEYDGKNTVMLSAGDSYDTNSYITKYKWDCNDDGIWDIEDVQPNASCEYIEDYKGLVVLEIESFDGQNSKAIRELNVVHKQQANPVAKLEKPNVQKNSASEDSVNFVINNDYPDGTVYKVYDEEKNLLNVANSKDILIENTKEDIDSKYGFIAQNNLMESEITWLDVEKLTKPEPVQIPDSEPKIEEEAPVPIPTEEIDILPSSKLAVAGSVNLVTNYISTAIKSTGNTATITKPIQNITGNIAYVDEYSETKPIGEPKTEKPISTENSATNVLGEKQTSTSSNPLKAIAIFVFIIGLISLVIYLSNRKYRNN